MAQDTYEVPIGSVMPVSEMPLQRKGIQDKKRHNDVFKWFIGIHLDIALDTIEHLKRSWEEVEGRLDSEW